MTSSDTKKLYETQHWDGKKRINRDSCLHSEPK